MKENKLLITVAAGLGAALVTLGTTLVTIGTAIPLAIAAVHGLNFAFALLAANPVVAVMLLLGAAAAGIAFTWSQLTLEVKDSGKEFDEFASKAEAARKAAEIDAVAFAKKQQGVADGIRRAQSSLPIESTVQVAASLPAARSSEADRSLLQEARQHTRIMIDTLDEIRRGGFFAGAN